MPTRKPSPKPQAAAAPPTKRPANRPPHVPSKTDRQTVTVMVAGGIGQDDIAHACGISAPTLRKYYKTEIAIGTTKINTIVLFEHLKLIKAGDFQAIRWWEQSRMGWSERAVVDDGKSAASSLRVVVEFMGEAAAPRVEQSAARVVPGHLRTVQ